MISFPHSADGAQSNEDVQMLLFLLEIKVKIMFDALSDFRLCQFASCARFTIVAKAAKSSHKNQPKNREKKLLYPHTQTEIVQPRSIAMKR